MHIIRLYLRYMLKRFLGHCENLSGTECKYELDCFRMATILKTHI